MGDASSQSLSQVNWNKTLRDGAASTTKAEEQNSDSIMPKKDMQPVKSTLPVVPETVRSSASKFY